MRFNVPKGSSQHEAGGLQGRVGLRAWYSGVWFKRVERGTQGRVLGPGERGCDRTQCCPH